MQLFVEVMSDNLQVRSGSLAGQTFAVRAEREKERLVTLDRFLWMSPECWQHQSDWRVYWSHDPYRFKREQEQMC